MAPKTIKALVFLTLLIHGIGHFQGVLGSLGVNINKSGFIKSWLLKGLGESLNRSVCLVLHLATFIIGILTALSIKGIILPVDTWQILALVTAFLSTVCLVLFPRALAMFFNKAGAIAVNLIIYYSILFDGQWPSAVFED